MGDPLLRSEWARWKMSQEAQARACASLRDARRSLGESMHVDALWRGSGVPPGAFSHRLGCGRRVSRSQAHMSPRERPAAESVESATSRAAADSVAERTPSTVAPRTVARRAS
eukprot:6946935-Prymnesium_polylepis.1